MSAKRCFSLFNDWLTFLIKNGSVIEKEISLKDNSEMPPNYEKLIMSETPNLLNSIKTVINDDFCVLETSDTLSDALALITLQKTSDILIVDNHGKFVGSISSISVVSKFPPQVSDVPVRHQIKTPSIQRQISNDIISIMKRTITDVFKLKKPIRRFSQDGYLISTLEELAKPYKAYTEPKIITILNNDETIAGVVSYQAVLEYIKNDSFWVEAKLEELLKIKLPIEELYTLLPEDTLDKACFAMDYLPIDYIIICDRNNNFLGMIDRHQVSALAHRSYYHLMSVALSDIMKPVESLFLVESHQNIKSIIDSFINLGIKAAIAVDRSADRVYPKQIITPANVIQLCLQNFRSNKK